MRSAPAIASEPDRRAGSMLAVLLAFLLLILTPFPAQCLSGQLDINTATEKELVELPYIGDERARAIVDYRREHGPFTDLDQLRAVSGIGKKSLEAIAPYLALTPREAADSPPATGNFHKKITTRPGDIIILADSSYYDTLMDFIRGADRSIDMTMFLFKTTRSKRNRPAKVVNELIKAGKRGVSIRIFLENSGYDDRINEENRKVAKKLAKNGIKVIFDSPNVTTHAKLVVIDGRYCFVGSHNLSHSALAFNHELSLLIDSKTLAGELVDYIRSLK